MSKAICAKSGIEFEIQHFPYFFRKGEIHHPAFDLDTKALLGLSGKWANHDASHGPRNSTNLDAAKQHLATHAQHYPTSTREASSGFTEIDTKLYFLSLLNSTGKILWRTYARPELAICELNMEKLITICGWINIISNPAVTLPSFVITKETASLVNVRYWIESWVEAKEDFENGYKQQQVTDKIVRRQAALERLIHNPQKSMPAYANQLAEWANLAGAFPTDLTLVLVGKTETTLPLNEYWKSLIRECGSQSFNVKWNFANKVSQKHADLAELLSHCEENLDHGTVYSYSLLKLLREALNRDEKLLGLGFEGFGVDKNGSTYSMLDESDDVKLANIKALVASAPETNPRECEYPNRVAYLKAKIRFNLAQTYSSFAVQNATTHDSGGELK